MNDSPVCILSACPDTLVLNCYPSDHAGQIVRQEMSMQLRGELEQLKKVAQDAEEPIPSRFLFHGSNLKMQAKGGDGFNWILKNEDITLAVNRSSKMLLWAQVRCSSGYLQTARDLALVITEVEGFLKSIFGPLVLLQPSSLDLAADVVFFDIGTVQDVKQHFVSRAQLADLHPLSEAAMLDGPEQIKQRWGRITGLPFGSRKGALSALLYDKTHEIKYQSPEKSYMWDIWQPAAEAQGFCLLPTARIWRIEIRYKRPALSEVKEEGVFHGIQNASDLPTRLAGLWSYAVGHAGGGLDGLPDGWLRYVIPVDDLNRSRWPVHPDWAVLQSAFQPVAVVETEEEREVREQAELQAALDAYLLAHPRPPLALLGTPVVEVLPDIPSAGPPEPVQPPLVYYRRARRREVNMRRLVAQIAGCTITAQAWRGPADETAGEADLSDTFHFLFDASQSYLEEKERDFAAQVHKKRMLYDLEQATDVLEYVA